MTLKNSVSPVKDIAHSKVSFGFWVYLMADLLLFGTLFAAFMVLRDAIAGGPNGKELFDLPFVFIETVILLLSSFACGLALLQARAGKKRETITWLAVTGVLGAAFLGMELYEFSQLVHEGYSWTRSAFLSAYFGLVGTHGLHITVGLVWLVSSVGFILRKDLTARMVQRLTLFAMFWHFLDLVWIGIFTIVYLMGAL